MEGGHFCPSVVTWSMSNSTEIEFGWNHNLNLNYILKDEKP
jgi:hypothetical protein